MDANRIDAPWVGVAIVFGFTALPALVAYGVALRRAVQLWRMFREWERLPGTIVASEWTVASNGRWRHVPTVEWSPEGRPLRFTPDEHRRNPSWPVGEHVTVLRHPTDWQQSRLCDPRRMYWQEVWLTVIGGTIPLLMLLGLLAERWGWIPRPT